MKRTLTLFLCLTLLSFSYNSQAQDDDEDSQLESLEYLKKVYKKDPKTPNISFFLGKAYLVNNEYDNALEQFNIYLTQKISAKQKVLTERLIENCNNAKALSANPIDCKIENLGPVVNS
jgi:lipopolysaccharide biosynthesis regulator YciM